MTSPASIVTSQITKDQRWDKLYRIIHHLFLRKEFIHTKDYNKMVAEMNARITMVEANAQAALSAAVSGLSIMVAAHTHMVPQAPAGVLLSGPAIAVSPVLPPTPKAPGVIPETLAMEAEDAKLMAFGPALAPLSGGFSPDQIRADDTVRSDIFFSEVSI